MLTRPGAALILQAALISAVAWFYGTGTGGWDAAAAVLYGGVAALVNLSMLWWRWWSGRTPKHSDPGRHLRMLHRSSLERFFVVGVWLAVGFTMPGLEPLALLSGFVAGQVALIGATLFLRERT